MDKELNQTMVNGNLLCNDLTVGSIKSESGFSVKKETKFKTVEVIKSGSEKVSVGDILVIPFHAGKEIDGKIIVNEQHIIYIK